MTFGILKKHCEDLDMPKMQPKESFDAVHRPWHYSWRGFEGIDLIKQFVKKQNDSFLAVCEANILKYLIRYPMKNNVEDLRKIAEYATMAADYLEDQGGEEDD